MIKAVLFDADGVLINSERFSQQLARDYGIPVEKTDKFFNGEFKECLIGKADLKKVILPHLREWGWTGTIDELLDYWFKSEHKIDEKLVKYIQILRNKGIRCYLATNQEKHRVDYMLDKMGFAQSFDRVYASAHLGHKKPAFEFYAKVMEDLQGMEKEEVLFWDDSVENVESAKAFGIQAKLYTSFEDFEKQMKNLSLV